LKSDIRPRLEELVEGIENLTEFNSESLETLFKEIVEKAGMKLGKLAQPVRVALTGKTASPGIYDVILLLGKETTLTRLKNAIAQIK
ncbi:MAG: glutamate--tRNA ligase, partial [Nitrospinaceae bacterium]